MQLGISRGVPVPMKDPIKYIVKPSIQRSGGEVLRLNTSPRWTDPIISYLKDGVLSNDKIETQKLQHMATRYILLGDILYKKSYFKLHSDLLKVPQNG